MNHPLRNGASLVTNDRVCLNRITGSSKEIGCCEDGGVLCKFKSSNVGIACGVVFCAVLNKE